MENDTEAGEDINGASRCRESLVDSLPLWENLENTGFINCLLCALPCWPPSPGGHMNHSNELEPH